MTQRGCILPDWKFIWYTTHSSGGDAKEPVYPSGQRGQTVNLLATAYVGSNPTAGTTTSHSIYISLIVI